MAMFIFGKTNTNSYCKSGPSADLTTDLELLELLLGDGIKDVCRVWVGSGALGHLEPILKPGVVIEELAPEFPRLLDPTGHIVVEL